MRIKKDNREIESIIFDMHGIISNSNNVIEFINKIATSGIKVGILTNNSTSSHVTLKNRLIGLGLHNAHQIHIMSASYATAKYVYDRGFKTCAVFSKNAVLKAMLNKYKIKTFDFKSEINEDVPLIVLGHTESFCYKDMCKIYDMSCQGAKIVATDGDRFYMSGDKKVPSTAWYIAAIEKITKKRVVIIGKPNTYSLKLLLNEMNTLPSKCLFIGDNLETDILCANRTGIISCLLLGGVSRKDEILHSKPIAKPHIIIQNIEELENKLNYEK